MGTRRFRVLALPSRERFTSRERRPAVSVLRLTPGVFEETASPLRLLNGREQKSAGALIREGCKANDLTEVVYASRAIQGKRILCLLDGGI